MLNEMGQQLCDMFEDLQDKKHEPFSKPELLTLMNYQAVPVQVIHELRIENIEIIKPQDVSY